MLTPVAEGIESQGVQVLTRSVEQVTWEEMLATDGIVVGNPTRFGGTDWQLKRLFDVAAIQDYPGARIDVSHRGRSRQLSLPVCQCNVSSPYRRPGFYRHRHLDRDYRVVRSPSRHAFFRLASRRATIDAR
ncbi:MAG: hypothetical protein O7G88_08940 [bacterium]|nr:hypothetical protein [bacterium]